MFKKFTEKKSSNPVLNSVINKSQSANADVLETGIIKESEVPMTVAGAINKTLILTVLMLITAVVGYANPSPLFMWGGAIGGLIMVLIGSFKPNTAYWSAPAYALFEGLFVGAISAIYAYQFEGIILQAVSLTIALLFIMLFLFQARIIKVTAKLRAGVMMATGAVMLVYLASFALSFFGINLPFLHEGGMIGIGICAVVLVIACLNLLLDFDNIEKGAKHGIAAKYEWVMAMGLLVTIVWIYLELLRLLSYLSRE